MIFPKISFLWVLNQEIASCVAGSKYYRDIYRPFLAKYSLSSLKELIWLNDWGRLGGVSGP
jgi:hypothetical protein